MGFFKKIFKPVSKVLDKIIPNEIKPALPFAAAFAPYLLPTGIMGAGMAQRALMGGGLNILGQLSQEGNEGDINLLSAGLGALSGAMTAPGTGTTTARGDLIAKGKVPDFSMSAPMEGPVLRDVTTRLPGFGAERVVSEGAGSFADFTARGIGKFGAESAGGQVLTGLQKASDFMTKPGLTKFTAPVAQGVGDLMFAQAKRDQDEYDRMMEEESEADAASDAQRAFAIRRAMEAQGATEEEIEDAIYAAGYKTGGRVGFKFGGIDEAIENVTEEIEEKGKEGIMQASREDPLLVEEYNKYVFDLMEQRPDAKPMSFQEFKRMIKSGMKSGGRVKMEEGGDIKEGIMLIADETGGETGFGSKEYYEKEVEEKIIDLNEMINSDKMYHLSPWSIGMIEELIVKANDKGVDILKLTETYEKAKNSQAEWFQSLPEDQQDFWKEHYQKDFDRTTDMGIFPGQEELGGMGLKDKSLRDDKVPAPKRDQFDIEGFDTLVQEAKDGGRIGLQEGGTTSAFQKLVQQPQAIQNAPMFLGRPAFAPGLQQAVFPRLNELEQGVNIAENKLTNIRNRLGAEQRQGLLAVQPAFGLQPLNMNSVLRGRLDALQQAGQGMKDGGMMDLGGKEMDLRKGGFVPIGKKERADDVPARLSKNEFVMTADAVRAAGGGSVNKGAKRMYNLMNSLEAKA